MIDNHKYIELHRYLTDQCDEHQRTAVETWINASDENKIYYNQIKNIWGQAQNLKPESFNYNLALAKAKINIAQSQKPNTRTFNLIDRRLIAVAATFLVVLCVWLLWPSNDKGTQIYSASNSVLKVALEDESLVFLDKNSSMETQVFSSTKRKVSLSGRAIFDVAKSKVNHFEITSKNFNVVVLGTSFVVDTERGSVKVIEGKVLVKTKSQEVTITTNESLQIVNEKLTISKIDSFSENEVFYNHYLSFNNQPLSRVFSDLGTFYNVVFDINNSIDLNKCLFTSGSLKASTLEEVLQVLKITFNLNYVLENNGKVKIKNIHCK